MLLRTAGGGESIESRAHLSADQLSVSHDLDELRDLPPDDWQTKTACDDLSALTDWVTEARYPTRLPDATANDADAAITQARFVYGSIEADLIAHGFMP